MDITNSLRRMQLFITNRIYRSISDYQVWISQNEPNRSELTGQRLTAGHFNYQPLISIIMPVWNTPREILDETITSVLEQTYSNWELCIADGCSMTETQQALTDWMNKDSRVRVKFLSANQGIASNSNQALTFAQGEFVSFLDHDDLLAPFALFEVVNQLQIREQVDVLFSDEDKTDESGRRFDPFFKPEFSPDYLRSVNYMPHLLVVRRSLGEEMKWFREGFDGAQDYDLILRLVERARLIVHIPKVLYHWRVWSSSTASGSEAKPYAHHAGKMALQEHLDRIGMAAEVKDGHASTFYRIRFPISNTPLISIIIPNQDHASDLEKCLASIFQKTTYPNYEILIVENGSKEPETIKLYENLLKDSRVKIIYWRETFNYSRVNNWAVTQTKGNIILFLNNDIEVINGDWLEEMLQFAVRSDIGAVGAKLYYPDGNIQHGGIIVGLGGVAGHSHKNFPQEHPGYFRRLVSVQNFSAITAACLMVRKQVFQQVNGFDENYVLAFGDVDLCLSILQKGFLNIWTPYAELYHHESKTRGYEDTDAKKERFTKEIEYFKNKWKTFLLNGDPYYSPNLTLDAEDFRLNIRRRRIWKSLQPKWYLQTGYLLARRIYHKVRSLF